MRSIALGCLLACVVVSASAQPRSVVLRDEVSSPPPPSVPLVDEERPPGFWTVLSASTLGGVIGGGLGALVGTVDPDDLERNRGLDSADDDGEIPVFPVGVWLGTTVGATLEGSWKRGRRDELLRRAKVWKCVFGPWVVCACTPFDNPLYP